MNHQKSQQAYENAQQYIPGGVNSPVRAFQSVGISPIFAQKAKGSHLWDIDGNEYIDYICSWGPMILGHSHPMLQEGLLEAVDRGISFGLPTTLERIWQRRYALPIPPLSWFGWSIPALRQL